MRYCLHHTVWGVRSRTSTAMMAGPPFMRLDRRGIAVIRSYAGQQLMVTPAEEEEGVLRRTHWCVASSDWMSWFVRFL